MFIKRKKLADRSLIIGLAALYILPPLGMAWLVICAIGEWRRIVKKKSAFSIDDIVLLFIMMMLASIGAALSNHQAGALLSTLIIAAYLGIYLSIRNHPDRLNMEQFAWVTILGGVYIYVAEKVLSLFSFDSTVGQIFSFMTGHYIFGDMRGGRLLGSAYNANYACYLLILAIAFLMVELLSAAKLRNWQKFRLLAVMLPILDLAVYDTGSRAGFVIMIALHLLFLYRWKKSWFIAATVLTVLSSPFIYQIMPRSDDTASSMDTRLEIWKNSLHIIADNPVFGVTSYGFRESYINLTGHMIPHAHDLFLSIFAISGVFCGLFVIATMFAAGYGLVSMIYRKQAGSQTINTYLFTLPTIVGYGILDFTLSSPQVTIIVLVLLSFWARCVRQARIAGEVARPLIHLFNRRAIEGAYRKKKSPPGRSFGGHF